jgi:hypothetical protein
MSDELVKRLRDRAKEERLIQANNEAVATALRGQRLLFDQGHRSPSNTYAVRLALNHEDCARHDAKLAADWDDAADCIEALTAERDETLNQLDSARHSVDVLEKRVAFVEGERRKTFQALLKVKKIRDEVEAKLAKAAEALEVIRDRKYYRMAPGITAQVIARATLAEIEGEKK